jgi:hypothetical protein
LSLKPPDLGRPYSTEADRAAAREALLLYWEAIKLLTKLAYQPASAWTPQQASLFPRAVRSGRPETPQQRLQRWSELYSEAIDLVHDVRSRLVHVGIVTDPELRGAVYLARSAISTVMGVERYQAEPEWAFSKLAPAAA